MPFETVIMVVGERLSNFKNQIDELKLPSKIEVKYAKYQKIPIL